MEVEINNVDDDMPLSKPSHHDFCTSGKLSRAVKSPLDSLPVGQLKAEQAASSASASVSSVSLPYEVEPANVHVSLSLKQESPELSSSQDQLTGLVTGCESRREYCRRYLLHGIEVKQEPLSPAMDTACHTPTTDVARHTPDTDTACLLSSAHGSRQLPSSDCGLGSATASVCTVSSPAVLMVGTSSDEVTAKHNCDNLPAAIADADANVMWSQSLTVSSDASHLSVSSRTVASPVCNSHDSSASASGVRSTTASVHQQLVKCRDSSGKTYYIPRGLLRYAQSSSAVNCTKSRTECLLPSTLCAISAPHGTSIASVTVSCSEVLSGKGENLSAVCDVDAKPVETYCHATEQQPTVTTATSSLSDCVIYSTKLYNTVTTAASTTRPSSAQGTLALSCNSHASMLTNAAVTSRHLMPDKVRMASVPYNSAVIKPRPLVPLSCANSPARSLPHITVLPTVSPVVMSTSRNVTPVSNVTTAKLPASSSPPVYFVVEGNNRVMPGNSRAIKEVILVPGRKNASVKDVTMRNVRVALAAGVNGRCASTLSASLSQCDGVTKVADNIVSSSSLQSVVSVTSLNKISKPAQLSRSVGQISLLRPQNIALSTKSTSAEPKLHMKRTISSSNVFATKIGNQTVIVELGSLSSGSSAAVKPSVTNVPSACSTKPKDVLVSKSACSQPDVSSLCGNVSPQSSAPRGHVAPDMYSSTTDDTTENCAPVVRYFNCLYILHLYDKFTLLNSYFFVTSSALYGLRAVIHSNF